MSAFDFIDKHATGLAWLVLFGMGWLTTMVGYVCSAWRSRK